LTTGANPVYPKPASRVVVNQMGESVRIAEKYLAIECAGCVIEPRTDRRELANTIENLMLYEQKWY